ncbi:MAG: choice-of-anchor D domain-containing protein [Kofleriaceae bacterium]
MKLGPRHLTACVAGLLLWVLAPAAARAAVTFNPQPVAFGPVLVGDDIPMSTTVTSVAGGDTITVIEKAGACDDLEITPPAPLPIVLVLPGDDFELGVSFAPTARASLNCTVTLRNGSATSLGSVLVTGQGVAPVQVTSPASLAFGAARVVGGTAVRTFTVSNTSTDTGQSLNVTFTLGGSNAGDFTLEAASASVGPGASTEIDVTFDPTALGARAATVTIAGNDPQNPSDVISLAGTGTDAIIDVTTDAVDLGEVLAGGSATSTVTVANTGSAAGSLAVTGATITGGAGWFTLTTLPDADCDGLAACSYLPVVTIAGGASTTVGVRCAPPAQATGTQVATITFASDTDAGGDADATLSCTAVKPDLALEFTSHDFGDVRVGTPSAKTLELSNTGTAPLHYSIVRAGLQGADYVMTGGCLSACTLLAGADLTYTITFTPGAAGTRAASFTFTSDDQETPAVAVAVTGVGVEPTIGLTEPTGGTLAFGNVTVGMNSAAGDVRITNTGTAPLSISSATVAGAAFALSSGTAGAQTVATGGTAAWKLTCNPASRGAKVGTFTIASDAANDPSLEVALTCQGVGGELTVTPSAIDFGDVAVGGSAADTVRVRNVGELAVTISAATLGDAGLGYAVDAVATTLATNEFIDVEVTFSPADGSDGGPTTLTFTSDWNDPVVDLDGNAQTAGVDVTPSTVDFGQVRWDGSAVRTFAVKNTGEATFTATLALGATADFAITALEVVGSPADPGAPFVLGPDQVAEVEVTATPNDVALGVFTATVTVATDLPDADDLEVLLRVESTSPEVTLDPGMLLDFGAVDLDGVGAVTLPLSLVNSGDGVLDVTDLALSGGGGVFTLAPPATPTTVLPGESFDVEVTFTPTVERLASAPDLAIANFTVGGLFTTMPAGPTSILAQLRGHGIDRHLGLPDDGVVFPDTYRNPGDAAPIENVIISNTGAADLVVSAVMLSGDDAFELLDTEPVTLAGFASAGFRVRFAPTVAGSSFTGELLITHDDDDLPSGAAVVPLTGASLSRQVTATSGPIDLGVTPVGVTVRLSDRLPGGLTLTNEADLAFVVQPLELEGDTAVFRLLDGDTAQTLEPSQSASFDVAFEPSAPGPYEATIRVLLDDDPAAHVEVVVRGWAVGTSARGGCEAGGGELGGGLLLVALALLVRRRAAAGALLVVLGVVAAQPAARADDGRAIDATTFLPRTTVDGELFEVQTPTIGASGSWALGLTLGHAVDPLQIEVDCGGACPPMVTDGMTDHPITGQTMALLGGAFVLGDRLEVGASVPLWMQRGDEPRFSTAPADGAALGDLAVHGKVRLWQRGALATGLAARIGLPTAGGDAFVGGGGPSAELSALVGWRRGRLAAAANLGGLARDRGVRRDPPGQPAHLRRGRSLPRGVEGVGRGRGLRRHRPDRGRHRQRAAAGDRGGALPAHPGAGARRRWRRRGGGRHRGADRARVPDGELRAGRARRGDRRRSGGRRDLARGSRRRRHHHPRRPLPQPRRGRRPVRGR